MSPRPAEAAMRRILPPILAFCVCGLSSLWPRPSRWPRSGSRLRDEPIFRAGAAAVDIAPRNVPGHRQRRVPAAQATRLNDPIRARCLVLDDGTTRLAIVVVDSCMMPRELLDRAKALAQREDRDPHRSDADLRDAHPLGALGDGGAGHPARRRLRRDPPGADRRGDRARRREPRAGPRSAGAPSTIPSTPSAGAGSAAPTR